MCGEQSVEARGGRRCLKHRTLLTLTRKSSDEEGLLVSTRLETHRPRGPGSRKSTVNATQYTLALGRTSRVSDWLLLPLPRSEKIERWGPFSWVQTPLSKATISIVSLPRPHLPKASHWRLAFPSFLTRGFRYATQTGVRTEDPSASAAAWVKVQKNTIAPLYCLWPSEWK